MSDCKFDLEVDKYNNYKKLIVAITIILFIIAYLLKLDIFYGVLIIILGTTSNIILKSKYKDILRNL
ncbi:MAG: hypothetical protein DRG78_04765 [Epsilonproteobacteria bacterium]|nr:MAG: hypothetical protein DRG78_04765 [Campylobacterota bacterium]